MIIDRDGTPSSDPASGAGPSRTGLGTIPETRPGPGRIGAIDLSVLALIIALAVVAIAAILSQRTADGADLSELLRHGD